jgi:transcriptional regulator with XRE-family HTH domain
MNKKKQEIAHPVDVLVGRKIREFRVKLDKSQKALGDMIGLTFQQIQKYESGKNRVSASILFEIAKALKTPIAAFFNYSEATLASMGMSTEGFLADKSEGNYIADEKALIHYFMQITDPKVRDGVINLLKHISESGA